MVNPSYSESQKNLSVKHFVSSATIHDTHRIVIFYEWYKYTPPFSVINGVSWKIPITAQFLSVCNGLVIYPLFPCHVIICFPKRAISSSYYRHKFHTQIFLQDSIGREEYVTINETLHDKYGKGSPCRAKKESESYLTSASVCWHSWCIAPRLGCCCHLTLSSLQETRYANARILIHMR